MATSMKTLCFIVLLAASCLNGLALAHSAKTLREVAAHESESLELEDTENSSENKPLQDEAQKAKEEEDDEADQASAQTNIEDEIKHLEKLHTDDKKAANEANTASYTNAPGCSVLMDAELDAAADPADVLRTKTFLASITKDAFILTFKGSTAQYKRFSLPAIQMPLQNLDRSIGCWRMYYKGKKDKEGLPHVFCAPSTEKRDEWMANIIKAVFCFNSGSHMSQGGKAPVAEKGVSIKLPEKSTKEERWTKQLADMDKKKKKDEEEDKAAEIPPLGNETTEVEIHGILSGHPIITVNGDELPLSKHPEVKEENSTMGSKEL